MSDLIIEFNSIGDHNNVYYQSTTKGWQLSDLSLSIYDTESRHMSDLIIEFNSIGDQYQGLTIVRPFIKYLWYWEQTYVRPYYGI